MDRYPCYCLPGIARCDDPYKWCDRAEQEGSRDLLLAIADDFLAEHGPDGSVDADSAYDWLVAKAHSLTKNAS